MANGFNGIAITGKPERSEIRNGLGDHTYLVPFPLSSAPPEEWCATFIGEWTRNGSFPPVRIEGSTLFLDCPLDELQLYTDSLKECIATANLECWEQFEARANNEANEKSEAEARKIAEELAIEEALGNLTTGNDQRQKYKVVPGAHDRQEYEGVGGWLLWLCVNLVILGPLVTISSLSKEYEAVRQYSTQIVLSGQFGDQFPGLSTYVTIECVLGALLAAFGIYAGVGLWRVRPHAVGAARTYFLLSVVYRVFMVALVPFAGLPKYIQDVVYSPRYTFTAMGICLVWISYLNRSKRVKNTYEGK